MRRCYLQQEQSDEKLTLGRSKDEEQKREAQNRKTLSCARDGQDPDRYKYATMAGRSQRSKVASSASIAVTPSLAVR